MIIQDDLDLMGKLVKDKTTGYSGIVTQLAENMTGYVQAAIRPQVEEGKNEMPEAHFIDTHLLEVIGDGVSEDLPFKMIYPEDIKLGDVYKDTVTGKSGVAGWLTLHINGCHTIAIKPKSNPLELLDTPAFDVSVKLAVHQNKKGVRHLLHPEEKKGKTISKTETKRPPGGPMRKVPSTRV